MKRKPETIPTSCRLEERDRLELEARAEKLKMSLNDLVKQYVIAGLREDDARTSIIPMLQEFTEAIRETRRDHAIMAAVLLAEAGKRTKEEGLEWAKLNIPTEQPH